ncbi:MAG: FAD-dependent monooxygenase [Pirellulales bacterium]
MPIGRHASGGHAGDEHATVMKMFADWASPLPEVLASTEPSKVIRADIIDRPPRRPWAQGRSVLVGDAAHSTTPNFGQGGGMAIEDAVVLARRAPKFNAGCTVGSSSIRERAVPADLSNNQ